MNIIILFDSYFGNTEQIAKAIENSFAEGNIVKTHRISEVVWKDVSDADLLIVGSPTRGFRPSENTVNFLKSIPSKGLTKIRVAAFDTRMSLPEIKSKSIRFIVKTGGYAAKHIAKSLTKKGCKPVIQHEGFLVSGEKGPLVNGEIERATKWAKSFVNL